MVGQNVVKSRLFSEGRVEKMMGAKLFRLFSEVWD